MALTVEDGTSKSDADSYVATVDCATYYTNMGYTDTAADEPLRRGTVFLDNRFLGRWKGTKATSGQALQWPRDSMVDEDGNGIDADTIPQKIVDACCEAGRIVPITQSVDSAQLIESVKAGSVEVKFAAAQQQRAILDLVDELVAPFLNPSGILVRA